MTTKEHKDLSFNNVAIKVCGFMGSILIMGFAWWMTTVWNSQVAQADEISTIKQRLASLEQKVDGVDKKVDTVQTGITTLVNLALKKPTGET